MRHVGSLELTDICNRIKQRIAEEAGPIGITDFVNRLKTTDLRRHLISLSHIVPSLASRPQEEAVVIPEASSGKSSELQDRKDPHDAGRPGFHRICARFIERLLIDASAFEKVSVSPGNGREPSPRDSPDFGSPKQLLILTKIVDDVTFHKFVDFYDHLTFVPSLLDVRFCFFKGSFSLILYFEREKEALKFYSCCERRLPNFTKTFGDRYEASFLKKRDPKVREPKTQTVATSRQFITRLMKLPPSQSKYYYGDDFVGVIVRNLLPNYHASMVVEELQKKEIEAKILEEVTFRRTSFCLLRLENIDDAERACMYLNRRVVFDSTLKCTIHPNSNFAKRSPENKNFKSLFRSESLDEKKLTSIVREFEAEKRRRKMSYDSDLPKRDSHRPTNGDRRDTGTSRPRRESRDLDSDSSSDSDSRSGGSSHRYSRSKGYKDGRGGDNHHRYNNNHGNGYQGSKYRGYSNNNRDSHYGGNSRLDIDNRDRENGRSNYGSRPNSYRQDSRPRHYHNDQGGDANYRQGRDRQ